MPDILSEFLKLIGALTATGAASAAFAYAIFRIFTTKWIETCFSERLEAFKHQQNQEIEHLRFRINTMMDRTVKLHQREFDVLPDTWSLLAEAFSTIEPVALGFQQHPDLNTMSADHLEEFLEDGPLTPVEKAELRAATDKNRHYSRVKSEHDLDKSIVAYNKFHANFIKTGIFIPTILKPRFAAIDSMLKAALVERQAPSQKFDKALALHEEGRPLLTALEHDCVSAWKIHPGRGVIGVQL